MGETNLLQLGIVYVLTNPAMPGLVKIGKTSRDSVDARLKELYSTGVPVPFECVFAGRVEDEDVVEKAFHLAFGPYRLNPSREFFQIEPEQAIVLLQLMCIEDVTPELQREAEMVDASAGDAARRLKSRRPNLNFKEMQIPIGAQLISIQSSDAKVTITGERSVVLNDEEMSLTAATRTIIGLSYSINPTPQWLYEGRPLREIYDETYGEM